MLEAQAEDVLRIGGRVRPLVVHAGRVGVDRSDGGVRMGGELAMCDQSSGVAIPAFRAASADRRLAI